ncbi:MAG: hypothetical protein WCQ99_12810 [Pseudomonadota bacterium]
MGASYLVIDSELKVLLEKFSQYHQEGSKEVLKLVLKMYLKLVDKSRRKGRDPFLIFQNLVERIVTGKLYETTQDKIDHLDSLLDETQPQGPTDNARMYKEIDDIKSMLSEFRTSGYAMPPLRDMKEFSPKDAAKLLDVDTEAVTQKKRQSYRDLRKAKAPRKIEF